MKKIKAFDIIIAIFGILLALWLILSWHEVIAHNMTPGYVYSNYNFFNIMLALGGN